MQIREQFKLKQQWPPEIARRNPLQPRQFELLQFYAAIFQPASQERPNSAQTVKATEVTVE